MHCRVIPALLFVALSAAADGKSAELVDRQAVQDSVGVVPAEDYQVYEIALAYLGRENEALYVEDRTIAPPRNEAPSSARDVRGLLARLRGRAPARFTQAFSVSGLAVYRKAPDGATDPRDEHTGQVGPTVRFSAIAYDTERSRAVLFLWYCPDCPLYGTDGFMFLVQTDGAWAVESYAPVVVR